MAAKKRSGVHVLEFEKARIVRALYDVADRFVAERDGGAFREAEGETLQAEFDSLIAHAHRLQADDFAVEVKSAARYLNNAMGFGYDGFSDVRSDDDGDT